MWIGRYEIANVQVLRRAEISESYAKNKKDSKNERIGENKSNDRKQEIEQEIRKTARQEQHATT